MKKLFNHRKRPYEDKFNYREWEEYDQDGYYAGEEEYEEERYTAEDASEEDYYALEEAEEEVYAGEDEPEGEAYDVEDESEEGYYAKEDELEEEAYGVEDESEEGYYAEEDELEEEAYDVESEPEEGYYAVEAGYGEAAYREENGAEEAYYTGEDEPEEEAYGVESEPEESYYAKEDEPEEEAYGVEDESEEAYYTGENEYGEAFFNGENGAEEGYYAGKGEYEAGYYAEADAQEEEYYAEEGESEEGYYAEDGSLMEDIVYEDEEEPVRGRRSGGRRPGGKHSEHSGNRHGILGAVMEMSLMDKIITGTGVVVLIMALVTGGIYASARILDRQVDSFVSVGSQLEAIDLPGEAGLLAVADAQAARKAAAEAVQEQEQEEEEQKEYEEEEYTNAVTVELNMASIQKDLKIKFVNKKTGKLISNVPFKVSVTDPDGKVTSWSDDDMDGIIYKTELASGKYKVSVEALSGDKYKDYALPANAQSAEVKKDIEYKKVDVANEIKTEAEVNVAKEDTRKNETQVENKLENTVAWVESTATMLNYKEVEKNTIADPASLAYAGSFTRLAQMNPTSTISESSKTLKIGDSFTLKVTVSGVNLSNVTWTSSNPAVATVKGNGSEATVEAVGKGSAVISYSISGSAVSGGDQVSGLQGSCMVTVEDTLGKGKVTVDNPSPAVAVGAQIVVKAAAAEFAAGKELVYTVASGRTDIAQAAVDGNGNITITGKAAGDATVTVSVNYKEGGSDATKAEAVIAVKVVSARTITLDKTSATVYVGTPVTINAVIANALTDAAVTAESSDTNVATAAVNGKAVTITGVTAGSATITVKHTENGQEIKAACTVTVKIDPKQDKTTLLKDVNGNQIYVEEGGKYREAVYADYYTAARFYIKGEAKYTGWQTIDGRVYYFDANGNKVTGEQVIQGAKYNFGSDGALNTGSGSRGIDVSKWNGSIDWTAVKNSGIEYVIIRSGYRGSAQGTLIEDPKFQTNIKGATAAGLKVGVYFFTQAVSEAEAVEEASMVLEQVKNYKLSYPIFLDVEASGGRADGIDKDTRTAVCKAFCQTIQSGGYTAGIYANKTWLTTKLDASALSAYKIWLAQYASAPTYTGKYDMWQYQSTGKVSGISGNVDMNWSYMGY